MSDVLAISGSLRADSLNTKLIRAATQLAPPELDVHLYEGLREIPPFDMDVDLAGPPEAVSDLRERVAAADGLLICTPEYNYNIPGVLKNALDWASTPPHASALHRKPVALMGASPTNFGTVRAQLALRQVFLWTGSPVVPGPEVMVFRAHERFDDDGRLVDEGTIELVSRLLEALAETLRNPLLVGTR